MTKLTLTPHNQGQDVEGRDECLYFGGYICFSCPGLSNPRLRWSIVNSLVSATSSIMVPFIQLFEKFFVKLASKNDNRTWDVWVDFNNYRLYIYAAATNVQHRPKFNCLFVCFNSTGWSSSIWLLPFSILFNEPNKHNGRPHENKWLHKQSWKVHLQKQCVHY